MSKKLDRSVSLQYSFHATNQVFAVEQIIVSERFFCKLHSFCGGKRFQHGQSFDIWRLFCDQSRKYYKHLPSKNYETQKLGRLRKTSSIKKLWSTESRSNKKNFVCQKNYLAQNQLKNRIEENQQITKSRSTNKNFLIQKTMEHRISVD